MLYVDITRNFIIYSYDCRNLSNLFDFPSKNPAFTGINIIPLDKYDIIPTYIGIIWRYLW